MKNKYVALKAELLDIVLNADDAFDMTDEDDVSDASAEFAYVLEQIVAAYEGAGFDVKNML